MVQGRVVAETLVARCERSWVARGMESCGPIIYRYGGGWRGTASWLSGIWAGA